LKKQFFRHWPANKKWLEFPAWANGSKPIPWKGWKKREKNGKPASKTFFANLFQKGCFRATKAFLINFT